MGMMDGSDMGMIETGQTWGWRRVRHGDDRDGSDMGMIETGQTWG